MPFLRKYGTGTGADIYVPLIKRGVVDFAVGADFAPSAGDVKISIDGGAAANIGTLPVVVAMGNTAYWKFVFSDAELTGKRMIVTVADSATKAVEDQCFIVETYGHASAMHPFDLGTASTTQTGDSFARIGVAGAGLTAIGDTRIANLDAAISSRLATAGYTAPDNAGIAAILDDTGTSGVVIAAGSKTGYSLSASGLDPVLVESSITAGAGLTDDAGTQLTSINARQALATILSASAAALAGAATLNVTIKQAAKPAGNTRIDATVDSSGNRSAVILKVPT